MSFDDDTREFLDALDDSTSKLYTAGLTAFQSFYSKSPKHFLDAIEEDLRKPRGKRSRVARNTLKDFTAWMKKKDYTPKTIRAYLASVQSLGSYYDVKITTRYVKGVPAANPVSQKFPWTLETVAKFIGMIQETELRAIAVTIFQSGMAIADIRALTYGEIKYEYEHNIIPICFDRPREKGKVPFMSFGGRWTVRLLQKVLKGRKLELETRIFSMAHRTIDDKFKDLADEFVGEYRGQNPARPHSLRAGFRTLLGDVGMDRDVAKFFMGQKAPEQDRVYHSRSREGWRHLYMKYMHALEPENWSELV